MNDYKLAQLAKIAVYDRHEIESSALVQGFPNTIYFENRLTSTEGFVCANEDSIVLVFRGSQQFQDWLTDIKVSFIQGPIGDVHRGFDVSYRSAWPDIAHAVGKLSKPHQKFYITGHSLGGALATVAAGYAKTDQIEHFPVVNQVRTFGSPRVYGISSSKIYNKMLKHRTIRYAMQGDAVTRVPKAFMGYRHVGELAYLRPDGQVIIDPSQMRLWVDQFRDYVSEFANGTWYKFEDHAINGYIDAIGKRHL